MNYSRPYYETAESLKGELRIANELGYKWRCSLVKNKPSFQIDWSLTRDDEVKGFVECKVRDRGFGDFPDCFLSLNKVVAGFNIWAATGLPVWFVVEFTDGLFYANMLVAGRKVIHAGRVDRGDPQDLEPIVLIEMKDFKKI